MGKAQRGQARADQGGASTKFEGTKEWGRAAQAVGIEPVRLPVLGRPGPQVPARPHAHSTAHAPMTARTRERTLDTPGMHT